MVALSAAGIMGTAQNTAPGAAEVRELPALWESAIPPQGARGAPRQGFAWSLVRSQFRGLLLSQRFPSEALL